MSSDSKLVDCAICSKQIPQTQLNGHMTSPLHLANLTQRFHTLSREHANQTTMLNTLRSVLTKADATIEQLLKEKSESQPIAIFDWQGGPSKHLQPFNGAVVRSNLPPPSSHVPDDPWPREWIEVKKDGQHITLAPVEFHETFTIMFSMMNYSYREFVRYFDCLVQSTSEGGKETFTDWIQVSGYQREDKSGLFFVLQRDGYAIEECIVERGAVELKKWQHITASIDHNGMMRLYIDGELRATHQSQFTPRRLVRDNNRVGAKGIDPKASKAYENLDGGISHVRIYNDACLTGEQIFHEFRKWQAYNSA